MNHLENNYRSQQITANSEPVYTGEDTLMPIVLGFMALIGAYFIFGIPLSMAAIHYGRKAIAAGSKYVGRVLLAAAWIELIMTLWWMFLTPA